MKQLLKTLVGCSAEYFKGDSIDEMIENLDNLPKEKYQGQSNYENMRKRLNALKDVLKEYKHEATQIKEGDGFSCSRQIYDHYKKLIAEKQEHFCVVFLDNKHKIIEDRTITIGTLNQSLVHPREVFAPAIELRAGSIVLVHNHPSGDTKPSKQDIDITKRLQEAGKIIGIQVLDHIIVGNGYFSFVDEQII